MSNKTNTSSSDRQMAVMVTCFKCKKSVNIKSTALCSMCNNRFEPDCDGYPEQTYKLLNQESKKKWRCKKCAKTGEINEKTSNDNDSSNITTRKKQNPSLLTVSPKQTKKCNKECLTNNAPLMDSQILSDQETIQDSLISPNKLSRSLDGTISDLISLTEMKEVLTQRTLKLNSTEQELDNMILENNNLHKHIDKLTAENNILKSLCNSSSIIENSPGMKQKKYPQTPLQQHESTPVSSKQNLDPLHIIRLEQKIVNLQQQLKDAEQDIKNLTQKLASLTHRLHNNTNINNNTMSTSQSKLYSDHLQTQGDEQNDTSRRSKQKNKLCILSNDKNIGSLTIIEEVFSNGFDYCHYIMPFCNIEHLLENLENKLKDFNLNDYCIIFIGGSDIGEHGNYLSIINNIRQSLQSLTHTNVVLCLPTYIAGAPIYNFKVEIFNNLLYTDLQNHKYACFLDSNSELSHEMFSHKNGKINKYGVRKIYDKIKSNILVDLDLYNENVKPNVLKCPENLVAQSDQFFL